MNKENQNILSRAILLSAFVISGVALVGIIHAFSIDWYLPTLAYGVGGYLAWQKFF